MVKREKSQRKRKTAEDAALRRLRWRFALINAVSILAVLALVVVAIYGITRDSIERQSRNYLHIRTEQQVRILDSPQPDGDVTTAGQEEPPPANTSNNEKQNKPPQNWQEGEKAPDVAGYQPSLMQKDDPPRVHDGFFALKDIFSVGEPNKQRLGSAVLLLGEDGELLRVLAGEPLSDENTPVRTQLAETAFDSGKEFLQVSLDGESYMLYLTPYTGDANGSYILSYLANSNDFATLNSLLRSCIIVSIPVFAIVLLISIFLAFRAMRPMAEAWQKQKDFVADAAHELRTPIAVIRSNADVLSLHPEKTIASQQKWLDYIRDDTRRMENLVNELLYLANTDAAGPSGHSYPNDISKPLREAIMACEPLFFERGLDLETEIAKNLFVDCDPAKMKKLFSIFLDNMMRHSLLPGKGRIHATQHSGRATITFSNDAAPLSEDNMKHLFDRFYRSDPSRNHGEEDQPGGYGLGLSIAQQLVLDSGGRIAASQTGGQIHFTLSWPVARQERQAD